MSRPGADYTYESQNDQRLDDLHSKIRSLRHVSLCCALGCHIGSFERSSDFIEHRLPLTYTMILNGKTAC